MSIYIVTGNYSTDAMKGMVAHPADRGTAVKSLIEGSGGKLLSYYVTLGDTDFHMTVETKDTEGMMAALMTAGAAGGVSRLRTMQAFTTGEFMAAQKRAGSMTAGYKAPGKE
jgi:uncharacterized protein with GYD domain